MATGWQMRDDDPQPRGPMAERTVIVDDDMDAEPTITDEVIVEAVRQTLAGRGGRIRETDPVAERLPTDVRGRGILLPTKQRDVSTTSTPPLTRNADIIATIRRLATGKYVHVEKLIEALS